MTLGLNSQTSDSDQKGSIPSLEDVRTKKAQQELLSYADGKFNAARQQRIQFERQWYINIAFYFGRQYVQWLSSTASDYARLYEPKAPPWRVRLVVNKVRAIIRTELAKVTKEKPRGFVIPASTDDIDLAAAKAAEAIFEHLWRDLGINRHVRQSSFWTLMCGTGFLKDYYDPNSLDSSGQKGKICVEPVTPFHLYVPDLQEFDIENQPEVTHCIAKSPEWVKTLFDKDVQPDSGGGAGVLETKFLSALGISAGANKNMIAVKEMWIKPNEKFKEGAVIVWAGDTILGVNEESLQYNHGEYPFTKFDHIPTGRFYSDSTIVDLVPLQKEYNRTRSQIIEAKNRMAKPQLIAPRGSIDPNKITSEPGLVILYTPGFQPPTPLPLTALPNYVVEELDRTQRDMDDVSSQHEITKGRTPPGVTAATAISYLQEEDDSKLSGTISSLEEGVEKVGRHLLSHVQQFWAAQRQIKVMGDNNLYESFAFSKADIKGSTDFRVEAGSATPRSRAAKQAFIMEMMDKQYIPPEKGLRYLDMAETNRLYEELQNDIRHAQRENLLMGQGVGMEPKVDPMTGQPAVDPNTGQSMIEGYPIHSWDNHLVHIDEHDNYRKKQEFDKLPDEVKMNHEIHTRKHKMYLASMFGQLFAEDDPRLDGFIANLRMGNIPPVVSGGQEDAVESSGQSQTQEEPQQQQPGQMVENRQ